MNKASKLISESILGLDYRNIECGTKWLQIKAPTIPTICKIVREWSDISLDKEYTELSIISAIPTNYKPILRGVARAYAGNGIISQIKYLYALKQLKKASIKQIGEAVKGILELIDGQSFFALASLAKNATTIVAKPK